MITYCYFVDGKKLEIRKREYVGEFPETGGDVHGVGGMEGVANETTFLIQRHAYKALTRSIRRQLGHHARRMDELLKALDKFDEG